MTNEKYITIKELAEVLRFCYQLKGVSTRAIRLSRGKYQTRDVVVKGGKSFEILLSSIEPELQEKYYSKIIPYFMKFRLKDITIQDILNFRKYLQNNKVSERRIKNIFALLNQIIKHFQNEGYIDKTCIFEVKRITDIPKRQIQILTPEQLTQLFEILKKKHSYLLPIVQNLITLKQPLNTILTGSEQEKKSLKRKIRKDFYKIKQKLGLTNYMFDDLRFSNFV